MIYFTVAMVVLRGTLLKPEPAPKKAAVKQVSAAEFGDGSSSAEDAADNGTKYQTKGAVVTCLGGAPLAKL